MHKASAAMFFVGEPSGLPHFVKEPSRLPGTTGLLLRPRLECSGCLPKREGEALYRMVQGEALPYLGGVTA